MRIRPVEEVVPDYTTQGDQIVNDIAKACQSLMGTTDNILALQRKDLPTAEANLTMFWETEEAKPLTIDNLLSKGMLRLSAQSSNGLPLRLWLWGLATCSLRLCVL